MNWYKAVLGLLVGILAALAFRNGLMLFGAWLMFASGYLIGGSR